MIKNIIIIGSVLGILIIGIAIALFYPQTNKQFKILDEKRQMIIMLPEKKREPIVALLARYGEKTILKARSIEIKDNEIIMKDVSFIALRPRSQELIRVVNNCNRWSISSEICDEIIINDKKYIPVEAVKKLTAVRIQDIED